MKKIFMLLMLLYPMTHFANNIQVTDIALTGINTTNKTVQVRFNIGWENSWRTNVGPANWDAAWIFIKYRRGGVGDWKHAYINNTGHIAAAGSTIATGLLSPSVAFNAISNPGIGAFVHRSTNGNGTFNCPNTQLQWNFGANGITNTDLVEIKVFAIEMVYVPQGEFAAGDNEPNTFSFALTTINTSNALAVPTGTGSLGGMAGGHPLPKLSNNNHKPLVANFPNGYNAFYCMKYEITQKGYVDFLNTLSYSQQKERVETNIDSALTIVKRFVMSANTTIHYRNGIRAPDTRIVHAPVIFYCDLNNNGIANEDNDGLDIACNFLNRNDVYAYLWWAGLRPMTEMEFEKGCRGNLQSVIGEFAWGDATSISATMNMDIFIDLDTKNERLLPNRNENRIIITTSATGPSRVGIFANTTSNRQSAGAAYYGMMDMTGNTVNHTVQADNFSTYTG